MAFAALIAAAYAQFGIGGYGAIGGHGTIGAYGGVAGGLNYHVSMYSENITRCCKLSKRVD